MILIRTSLAALVALSAIAPAAAQPRPREARPQPPTRADVMLFRQFPAGERLAVVSVNGARVVAADRPVFTFTGGLRMSGFGGCNPVNADFRYGPRMIRFGPLNFVEKRCGAAIDRQERAIFWAMQAASAWRPDGRRGMVLTGRRGTVTLAPAF